MDDKHKGIDISTTSVEVKAETRPLRAAWTRTDAQGMKVDFTITSYSIKSVFRAVDRIDKLNKLYGFNH